MLLAIRESGPIAARQVTTLRLAQGAAFDISGDVALNTAHREIIAGNPHGTSKADLGLDNVTNDAQLKRAAGDFQAFAQKISPVGGDSLLSEDSADGQNKKRITLTSIFAWLKSLFSSIDYQNPIALTGVITPGNGDFFTTDSKLITLTGSGGEKFWPNGGLTSRIIWGASSGAALPVVIDPVKLGIGGIFEIAIDDGESRKIRYDGTDFIKAGGVVIKGFAKIGDDSVTDTDFEITENTDTFISMTTVIDDSTGQMGASEKITTLRPGVHKIINKLVWSNGAGDSHSTENRVYADGAFLGNAAGVSLDGGPKGSDTGVGEFQLNGGVIIEPYARQNAHTTTNTLDIFRSSTTLQSQMSVREVDPW